MNVFCDSVGGVTGSVFILAEPGASIFAAIDSSGAMKAVLQTGRPPFGNRPGPLRERSRPLLCRFEAKESPLLLCDNERPQCDFAVTPVKLQVIWSVG